MHFPPFLSYFPQHIEPYTTESTCKSFRIWNDDLLIDGHDFKHELKIKDEVEKKIVNS